MSNLNLRRDLGPVMPVSGEWFPNEAFHEIDTGVELFNLVDQNRQPVCGVAVCCGPFLDERCYPNVAVALHSSELLGAMMVIERFVSQILGSHASLLDTATLAVLSQVHMIAARQTKNATIIRTPKADAKGGA